MNTRLDVPRLTTALTGPLSELERRLLAQHYAYGVIARLALLAAAIELEHTEDALERATAPADTRGSLS